MTLLRSQFQDRAAYAGSLEYYLAPFRFHRMGDRYLLANDVGEFVFVGLEELTQFASRELKTTSATYRALKAKHFLFDDQSRSALDLLALKYASRAARIADFTALHIFVVTLRCDQSCQYCQVSRKSEQEGAFD